MTLKNIQKANDIQKLAPEEYGALAQEIREFLIEHISKTGGHLASNLGVVELTMALHLSFHLPQDKLVWDVGHQAYTHKLLTGRREGFKGLRQYGGMSGFPKYRESECDAFDTGHSSTSISAGLGLACARDLKNQNYHVVSIIGDGSLTGGMAYEALNNAADLKSNFIIVLNDNEMSISRNVGSMSHYLRRLRTAAPYTNLKANVNRMLNRIPEVGNRVAAQIHRAKSSLKQILMSDMFFENMGITYFGPVDGHDIPQMLKVFEDAKRVQGPVLVHVHTQKGRGYQPAVENPEKFHGVGPFDKETGRVSASEVPSYTEVFADAMYDLAKKDRSVVAVTAAMADGTGLAKFARYFGKRFFDVGIAEEHAVTFAAGMATQGLHPVVAIYSSFLQRAYDQILHDVCIRKLPVVLAVDRAGIVGNDGETHQGIFDLSFLTTIPNLVVAAPKNGAELREMLFFAASYDGPMAIRYPRGQACRTLEEFRQPIEVGKAEILCRENSVALLAIGNLVERAMEAAKILGEEGIPCTVVNMRFAKPIDTEVLDELQAEHRLVVTLEENVQRGGLGEHVAAYLQKSGSSLAQEIIAVPNCFVEQGTQNQLRKQLGMDVDGICATVRACWKNMK